MIIVHHLNESRSQRILWLLEELGLDYELKRYTRDPATRLAPAELKQVHPLGKSPVIERDGKVFAESGAIIELLAESEAGGKLAVKPGDPERADYLYWLHFAEGSAMLPFLLKIYAGLLGDAAAPLMQIRIEPELESHLSFIDAHLAGKDYLVANRFTAADIEISTVLEMAARMVAKRYPNVERIRTANHARPAYQRAMARGT